MGFGFTTQLPESVQKAIRDASSRDVIMFGAAGNHSGNDAVTYPGRDPRVICIYSTDGYGNRSAFNPPPLLNSKSFSTLGEEVELS